MKWLLTDAQHTRFTDDFGYGAEIKPRSYAIIAYFIPLTFDPENVKHLREVEEINDLPTNTITKANWIKPKEKRAANQTCGHAIFTTSSPDVANSIISKGFYICHKRIKANKCKREPLRCLRCQRWNHVASSCPAPNDICGTCGNNHRTANCTDNNKLHCTPCGKDGHASWDRSCPTFVQKCKDLDTNNIENRMPYYPTDEPWTHAFTPPANPTPNPHGHRSLSNEDRHYIPNTHAHQFPPPRPNITRINQNQNHHRAPRDIRPHLAQTTLPFTSNEWAPPNDPNPRTRTPEGWGDRPPSPLSAFNRASTSNSNIHLTHA